MSRRVVITGVGPVTAFGIGIDPLWEAMLAGRSAIKRIEIFDPSGFPCKIAGELNSDLLNIRKIVPKSHRKAIKVMCRDIELAVAAASAAVDDAGLITKATDAEAEPTYAVERMGCHIGAGLIAADVDELSAALYYSATGEDKTDLDLTHWGESGMENLTPLWLLKYLPNMLSCHVTIIHDCQGPTNTITCAEASGGLSICESMRVIQRGASDACLSGAIESKLNPMAFLRQHFAGRLAETSDGDDPTKVVRPFAPDAIGTAIGEGGGIVILEELESAQKRNASVYAEIAGFAATQSQCPDATGLCGDEDGQGISDAIDLALERANLKAKDIDAIAPFGCGIKAVDQSEAAAIRRVFGERAANVPLITTIPNVGNTNAGAFGVTIAVAAKAIGEQKLPARINTTGAEGIDANEAPAGDAQLNNVVATCTGQGGQNVAIVLRKI
ncbi:MAG: hypothetical protein IH984_02555 [Planctomycetes bacterium]|nr:hypothetical protein [Planctomycetota bacterium]